MFSKSKVFMTVVAVALAAVVLAIFAGTAKAATPSPTPNALYGGGDPSGSTYQGNINGYTHCFVTWSKVGCQMSHDLSKEIVSDTAAGAVAVAAGILCTAITKSPAAGYGCGFFAGALTADVLNRISWMPWGYCIEVGLGLIPFYNQGTYAAMIPCTVE